MCYIVASRRQHYCEPRHDFTHHPQRRQQRCYIFKQIAEACMQIQWKTSLENKEKLFCVWIRTDQQRELESNQRFPSIYEHKGFKLRMLTSPPPDAPPSFMFRATIPHNSAMWICFKQTPCWLIALVNKSLGNVCLIIERSELKRTLSRFHLNGICYYIWASAFSCQINQPGFIHFKRKKKKPPHSAACCSSLLNDCTTHTDDIIKALLASEKLPELSVSPSHQEIPLSETLTLV